ncbi:MAG: methylated-DNA--[protein]-cysteine S-methyltransferase [Candidatus Saccharicenans sp.]
MKREPTSEMKIYYHSPIGILELSGDEKGLRSCSFVREKKGQEGLAGSSLPVVVPRPLKEAWQQLDQYFKGQRQRFSVKLNLSGSPFQKKVWEKLKEIPFGQTRSYKDIAVACGHPAAFRAVGGANHKNPVVIIIPCHRVIGRDGRLIGFGAGLWRKKWLLQHEKNLVSPLPGFKKKK